MRQLIPAILFVGVFFFTASAFKLPADDFTVQGTFGDNSKEAAAEAILIGHILRTAARELEQYDDHSSEVEEYSFEKLLGKAEGGTEEGG
ncbi:hypothetical protein MRX96_021281 [Rhipicephalus microplus]